MNNFTIVFSVLHLLRQRLESIEIKSPHTAHFLCKIIPASCPFERKIEFFNHTIYIPPLCKLNPFYEQLVALRFKSLVYLAEQCGEDPSFYC